MTLCALLLVLCVWRGESSSFSQFKKEMEAVAVSISSKMEQYYE